MENIVLLNLQILYTFVLRTEKRYRYITALHHYIFEILPYFTTKLHNSTKSRTHFKSFYNRGMVHSLSKTGDFLDIQQIYDDYKTQLR